MKDREKSKKHTNKNCLKRNRDNGGRRRKNYIKDWGKKRLINILRKIRNDIASIKQEKKAQKEYSGKQNIKCFWKFK